MGKVMLRLLTIMLLCGPSLHAAIPIIFLRAGTNAAVVISCAPNDYTNAYAYWPMDTFGSSTPDLISGRDFQLDAGDTETAVSGIISNGIQVTIAVGLPFGMGIAADSNFRIGTLMGTNGNTCGFTVRVWCKKVSADGANILTRQADWALSQSLGGGAPSFTVYETGLVPHTVTWGSALSTTDWSHVVGWYDRVTGEIGISVNNGTPVTDTFTGTLNDPASGRVECAGSSNPGSSFQVDEVSIWQARILSAAERTSDYNNSGYGTTYPFTATRILDPEGGHIADPEDGSLINDPGT